MTSLSVEMLAADAAEPITSAGNAQLGIAVLAGIAVIVLLITKLKMHAFLALTIGSLALGSFAGAAPADTIASFTAGLGSTVAGVGVLIALGAILGKLLADSGGADQVVDTILAKASGRAMPWAMVLIASIIGLPLFFEVGIVLMIPVVLLVAKRGNYSLMRIGIPALAGLSVMHGLIPPHPGPLVAIDALDANLGVTLALGVLVAVPTVIIAGPVFSRYAARWVDIKPPENMIPQRPSEELDRRPSFGATLATILLPVFLMLLNALVEIVVDDPANGLQKVTMVIGSPLIALLAAVLVGMFTLGRAAGFTKGRLAGTVEKSLAPIAGILLIVGAGGGFKQTLIDAGVGQMILDFSENWSIPACRHHLGRRSGRPAGRRHVDLARGAAGAGGRRRFALLQPCERRRVLAGEGVLRHERGPDGEDLVRHGDDHLRGGDGVHPAALAAAVARSVRRYANAVRTADS